MSWSIINSMVKEIAGWSGRPTASNASAKNYVGGRSGACRAVRNPVDENPFQAAGLIDPVTV